MFRKKAIFFLLVFLVTFLLVNEAFGEVNRRLELKKKFAPSQNIQQLSNTNFSQVNTYRADANESLSPQTTGGRRQRRSVVRQERAPAVGEYAIYQSEYVAEIEEEIALVKGRVVFEVFKSRGWVKIPLVSSSAGLREVSLNGKPSFVTRQGSKYILLVNKPGKYKLNLEFFLKVKREREHGPGSLAFKILPSPISILDVQMEEKEVEIFVEPSIKVETEKLAKKTVATVVLPYTEAVTIRWSKALPKEVLPEVALEPKIYADTTTLVSVGDGVAKCFSNIRYSILQSEVSNLRISFPEDVGILEVKGRQLRDWKVKNQNSRQVLDVYLNYGVKGAYNLSVTYERNIGAGSVTAQVPDIHIVGAERERGFVGIEALTNIELAFNKLSAVSVIDVKQLPQNLWNLARNPVLLAFKYLKFPYQAVIDVTKHEELPVLVATIDSVSYVTLYTEEGKALTKATYQTRNNVKQFVRLSLPADTTLWSCFVSGKPVKPAKDKQGRILVPLEKSQRRGQALTQFPVEVVYLTQKPKYGLLGKLKLRLPKLDIPQNELFWSVYFPEEFAYYRFDGDVKLVSEVTGVTQAEGSVSQLARPGSFNKREHSMSRKAPAKSLYFEQQVVAEKEVFDGLKGGQARGVLPIKISLPERGKTYRFSKILVTEESPWLSTFYIRSPRKPFRLAVVVIVLTALVAGIVILIKNKFSK